MDQPFGPTVWTNRLDQPFGPPVSTPRLTNRQTPNPRAWAPRSDLNSNMAQYLTGFQQGIVKRYYNNLDSVVMNTLQEVVSDLAVAETPAKTMALWQKAHNALKKTPADQMKVGQVVAARNVAKLAELIEQLGKKDSVIAPRAPLGLGQAAAMAAQTAQAPAAPKPAAGPRVFVDASVAGLRNVTNPLEPQNLDKAFKAFKKRFNVMQLDADSKLSRRIETGVRTKLAGIQPPMEYPRAAYEELVKQGRLKNAGAGLYTMP